MLLLLLVLPLSACSHFDTSAAKSYGIDVEWYVNFDGGRHGGGNYIDLTSDGGYILTGGTSSPENSTEIWLIKTDVDGNLLWERTLGGEDGDVGYCVQQTTDGGYILVGETYSSYIHYRSDVLLIKTDADGNETWRKLFYGSGTDAMYCVIQATDGGYTMVGHTDSNTETDSWDIWLIKTDADGNKTWSKTFGGDDPDIGYYVQQTADGGYILVGETNPNAISPTSAGGETDVLMIKTDADGNELWTKRFGGIGEDIGYCVQQTADGGYIVAGVAGPTSEWETQVAWLMKTDANGNEMWSKAYSDFLNRCTYNVVGKYYVQQTSDLGYIISGSLKRADSYDHDGLVIKTDSEGNYLWHITFGGSKGGYASCVRETGDGDYIVTGYIAKEVPFWNILSDAYSDTDCVLLKIGAGS